MDNKQQRRGIQERQIWYLPKALVLEEVRERHFVLRAIIILSSLVLAFIVWASVFHMDEMAVAFGEVIPLGNVKVVQHLEGGIVENLLVRNGQEVQSGQLLVKLDPTLYLNELRSLQSRLVALQINASRLRAFAELGELKRIGKEKQQADHDLKQILDQRQYKQMLADDSKLLSLQKKVQETQQAAFASDIEQRKMEITKLKQQETLVASNIKLLQRETLMYNKLQKTGHISVREHLRAQRELLDARNVLVKIASSLHQAQAGLQKAKHGIDKLTHGSIEEAVGKLSELNGQMLQINYTIKKLKNKIARTDIRASETGLVKGLEVSKGGVIPPGGVLLTIVPYHLALQAEVKIKPEDIGHIREGDKTNIKVLTYDYSRFGTIPGKIINISATTFIDPKDNASYYRGLVALSQPYIKEQALKLKPGMTIEADIVTGRKTLLAYLFKPITLLSHQAFRER